MTARAHCYGHAVGTKSPRSRRPIAWHHGDVPRNWHLERYPGKYVAIDVTTDEVVLFADTPQELHEMIQIGTPVHITA